MSSRAPVQSAPAKSPRASPAATCSHHAVWQHSGQSRESTSPRSPPYWGSLRSARLPPAAKHHFLRDRLPAGACPRSMPSPSTRLPKSNQQRETHLSDGKRESPRFNQAGTCSSRREVRTVVSCTIAMKGPGRLRRGRKLIGRGRAPHRRREDVELARIGRPNSELASGLGGMDRPSVFAVLRLK
jgi:hypothetical protein